jgi:response regulator RpfG family c-di-GMP phosphodiesterase
VGSNPLATVPKDVIALLLAVTRRDGNGLGRARRLAVAASAARKTTAAGARADCEVGARMAGRFRLGPQVSVALDDIFERWDGKGAPRGKRQDEIALPARFAAVAFTAVMFDEVAGAAAAAAETVRRWSGRLLDPSIAAAFDRDALEASVAQDALVSVVQAEPGARHWVSEALHDLGRAAVPTGVWEKPGPLSTSECSSAPPWS